MPPPAKFQGRFNEFVSRAEEYSTAVGPFFPDLVGVPALSSIAGAGDCIVFEIVFRR